jgi:hypothetical protein
MHRLVLLPAAGLAVLAVALAQDSTGGLRAATPTAQTTVQTFAGTSNDGNLQQALDAALTRAQQVLSKDVADHQFRWQLDAVSGVRGGITGSRTVEVKIRIVP